MREIWRDVASATVAGLLLLGAEYAIGAGLPIPVLIALVAVVAWAAATTSAAWRNRPRERRVATYRVQGDGMVWDVEVLKNLPDGRTHAEIRGSPYCPRDVFPLLLRDGPSALGVQPRLAGPSVGRQD